MTRNSKSIVAALLFLVAVVATTFAQERTLTIEQCLALGLERDPGLHATRMEAERASGGLKEARVNLFPKLSVSGTYRRLSNEGASTISVPPGNSVTLGEPILNNYSLQTDLEYPVFNGFRVQATLAALQKQTEAAKAQVAHKKAATTLDIVTAFWKAVEADRRIAVIEKNLELVEAHLQHVTELRARGVATQEDVLQTRMRLSETQLMRIEALSSRDLAHYRLALAIGVPDMEEITLQPEFEKSSVPKGDLTALIARALGNRNDLFAAQRRIEAAVELQRQAEAAYYPQIIVTGNYSLARPNSRIFPPDDSWDDSWAVGITARIGLSDIAAAPAKTAQARAREAEARDQATQLEDGIRLSVTRAYYNVQTAVKSLDVAETMIAQATESLKVTEEKFKNGIAKSTDVLSAQLSLLNAEMEYTNRRIDRELAVAALAMATGETDELYR